MPLLTRRRFLTLTGASAFTATSLGGYAFGVEPGLLLERTTYAITPPKWPAGLALKIVILADIHACEPWMPASRVRAICEIANAMQPDLVVLLGDFNGGHNMVTAPVMPDQWGEALSILKAPLGVHAVLGNHDWWHGALPKMRGDQGEGVRKALKAASVRVLENDAVRLVWEGSPFWLVGLSDQLAVRVSRGQYRGFDDLDGALRLVSDDAPIVLLAHEPFVFGKVPERVAITLCGHTHGGQVNLPFLGAPFAARRFGKDHVYGHIVENGRHMLISAGLGTSIAPIRFMRPPEIVELNLGQPAIAGVGHRLSFT
jgi:predicted MPP superfamily phosphohydrolase